MDRPILRACFVFLLLLLITASFGRTVGAPFLLYDDPQHVMNNVWLKEGSFWNFWQQPYFGLYIPVTYTLWTALYKLSSAAWAFHLANVLIHVLNAGLCFLILRRRFSWAPSLVAAGVFALHPMQLETVAWVACGRDLIGAAFGLAALQFALSSRRRLWPFAVVCFVLGTLAKPSLVVLPVALFILKPKYWRQSAFWLLACLPIIYITSQVQAGFVASHLEPLAIPERLLIVGDALGFYLGKLIYPWPMLPDYSRALNVVLQQQLWLTTMALSLIFLVATGVVWKIKGLQFIRGPLLFVVFAAPMLGFLPFLAQAQSTVADHYIYLSMLGLAYVAANLIEAKRWAVYPVVGLALIWSTLNWSESEHWLSDRNVFTHILEHNPNSYLAHANLGVMDFQASDMTSAERHFLSAIKLEPLLAIAPSNLAQLYWLTGQLGKITAEIAPLLQNAEFLRYNEHEISLNVLYQMVGRTAATTGNWPTAVTLYCKAAAKDRDPALLSEATRVFEAATKALGKPISCD
jgi:hypothetical protein